MNLDERHPIRKQMFWVVLVQAIVTVAAAAGIASDVTEGWQEIAVAALNVLVLLGVLGKGTTQAEEYTVPLDGVGEPLNDQYVKVR